jgi:tRNA G18 (ribose-2'-O)-methylase SpoU
MGFGMKFPVFQLTWEDIVAKGLLSSDQNVFLADNTEDALPYYECDFLSPFVLVIGSEAEGISVEAQRATSSSSSLPSVKCQRIKIPLKASAESLNAAVACAMILGEATRQRSLAQQSIIDNER